MSRFSDIRRGGELKQALDAYTNYLQNPPARQINSRGDRAPSKEVYVVPYTFDIETDELVSVTANEEGLTKLKGIVNGTGTQALVTEDVGSSIIREVGRFRPARVVTFENGSKTKTVARSKYTNQQYLKYAGTNYACPFGQQTTTNSMQDAFSELRKRLKARQQLAVNRVSFTLERLYAA